MSILRKLTTNLEFNVYFASMLFCNKNGNLVINALKPPFFFPLAKYSTFRRVRSVSVG